MKVNFRSLTLWIFIGLFAGLFFGKIFGESIIPIADVLGGIFLKLLRMAIMPLIITSIVSGVISIGGNLGRLGVKTILYYMGSSLLAIMTGQILVTIFRPGTNSTISIETVGSIGSGIPLTEQGIGSLLQNIIPENPFAAMADGDVLPIIFFSILVGIFITKLKGEHQTLLKNVSEALFQVFMKMVQFIIWSAPLGVFGINAKIIATTGFSAFESLLFYFFIVLAGLTIHAFLTLPIIIRMITGKNPLHHYTGMSSALATAFSTCSSVVTLPLTMEAVTKKSKVSRKIANFVLPIGATVNMDGTALYEGVAVIFIAQIYSAQTGYDLLLSHQAVILVTALLASIGAASVPMSGMVMMSIILGAIGLPLELVALILPVDRVLDMFRTMVNVLSDSCGAVVIAKLEGEDVL